jgi:hypothetical protein
MKTSLILLFIVAFMQVNSQITIRNSSFDSGGSTSGNGALSVTASIGEVVAKERIVGQLLISEGFIHPQLAGFTTQQKTEKLVGVSVFPNPATEYLQINLPSTGQYDIKLLDASGKVVLNYQSANQAIVHLNVTQFNSGIYWLTIGNIENGICYKIVKK